MQFRVSAFCHVFVLISSWTIKGSDERIYQTPSVTGREGGSVIMNCTLSHESLGPIRWYKGENQQQLLYSQLTSEKSDVRVNKTIIKGPTRNTDMSFTFRNITWEDAGMYYCVKFKSDKVTIAASGNGTQLYVTRRPTTPTIYGPRERVLLNTNMALSCVSTGFSPPDISVTWSQNGTELQGSTFKVHSCHENEICHVQSNIIIKAEIDSDITCGINHTALDKPIHSTFEINNVVKANPSCPVILNVTQQAGASILTCTSSGFFPGNVSVEWIINGSQMNEFQTNISKLENGTYNLHSTIKVTHKDVQSGVICQIMHLGKYVTSEKFNPEVDNSGLHSDSPGLAITIIGALRCILGAVHLGVIIFLCYLEIKKRTDWRK